MKVSKLISCLQRITNQNKEVYIKETTITNDTFYSATKPMVEIKEFEDKVIIK
jgi:hypothetical protein